MYADPRGECVGPLIYACAAAAGAAVNVAIGIILDFYIGDGCYTWEELARDAALGAAGGPIGLYGRVGAAGASAATGYADDVARAVAGGAGNGNRAVAMGSGRSPMQVPGPQNIPTTIGGRSYTGHALDQMQGRGFVPSVVEDTVARGVRTQGYDGATIYTTEQARVILNPNGSVKTVMGQ